MTNKTITTRTPLDALNDLAKALGSQAAVGRHLGVGRQHVSDMQTGRRNISAGIAKTLGFRRRIVFEEIARR